MSKGYRRIDFSEWGWTGRAKQAGIPNHAFASPAESALMAVSRAIERGTGCAVYCRPATTSYKNGKVFEFHYYLTLHHKNAVVGTMWIAIEVGA